MTSSIQRLGVKQTPWQTDRQQERPWLHSKGGFFLTLLLVNKILALYISLFYHQQDSCLWTGSTSSRSAQDRKHNSSGLFNHSKILQTDQQKLVKENLYEDFKIPSPQEKTFFFLFTSPLGKTEGLFSLCTAANVCYLIPISTFLQLLTLPVVLEVSVLPHVALGHFLYLLLFNWQTTTTTTNSIQSHRVYHYVLEFHGRMKIFKM